VVHGPYMPHVAAHALLSGGDCPCCCSTKLKLDVWFNTAFVKGDTLVIEKLGVDKLKKDFDHRKVRPPAGGFPLVRSFSIN